MGTRLESREVNDSFGTSEGSEVQCSQSFGGSDKHLYKGVTLSNLCFNLLGFFHFSLYSFSRAFIAFRGPFSSPKLNPGLHFCSLPACFSPSSPQQIMYLFVTALLSHCGVQSFIMYYGPTMERVS